MKKMLIAFVLGLIAATGIGYALTVNPTSNVLGDSDNTATTLVYRDTNGDFAAGTITATTVSAALSATTITVSSATVTNSLKMGLRTKAQFDVTAAAVGTTYLCSDCTIAYSLCVATGTGAAQWKVTHSATVGCGTNN